MDNLTSDVENRKNSFVNTLRNDATKSASEKMYDLMMQSGNPKLMQIAMTPDSSQQQEMPEQMMQRGGIPTPREYRKAYRQMKRMTPRGVDISRANIGSGYYNKNMMPGFGRPYTQQDMMGLFGATAGSMGLPTASTVAPSIYVEDTDWRGRPKKYLIDYSGQIVSNMMPTRDVVREAASEVNSQADPGEPSNVKDSQILKNNPKESSTAEQLRIYKSGENPYEIMPGTKTPEPLIQYDPVTQGAPSTIEYDEELCSPGMNCFPIYDQYKEVGGVVNADSMSSGMLAKFIYGGGDADMIVYNEQDLPMAQYGGGPGWQYYTDWLFEKPTKIYKPGEDPYEITSTPLPEELVTLNNTTDSRTTDGPLVRRAQLNYVPRYKTTSGGLFRTLAPWNPAMSYAGSWAKQMTLPYMAGTATPYGGGMEGLTPVARQVTKSGLLGRPKKWTDYYATPGMSGTQLYRSSTGELQGFNPSGAGLMGNAKPGREERESATPGERYGVDKETWDAISAKSKGAIKRGYRQGQRNDRRVERAEEKEKFFPGGSILNNSTSDNPFNTQSACPPGYFKDPASGLCKNFAGEVSPSTQASTAAATFQSSAQAQMNTDPFQATGTNSLTGQDYMYTKDGQLQKNNLDPVSDLSQQSELVGVDYKRKDMRNFDPESALNQFNAGARGVLNFVDKLQNRGKENTMLRETTGIENIASEQTPQFRGDWVDYGSQLGQYRFNDMGQNRSSFSSYGQKGGFMQTGGYTQDDEVYMTDEEIADFIANGGEIEYL
jgi:hypothetical protein